MAFALILAKDDRRPTSHRQIGSESKRHDHCLRPRCSGSESLSRCRLRRGADDPYRVNNSARRSTPARPCLAAGPRTRRISSIRTPLGSSSVEETCRVKFNSSLKYLIQSFLRTTVAAARLSFGYEERVSASARFLARDRQRAATVAFGATGTQLDRSAFDLRGEPRVLTCDMIPSTPVSVCRRDRQRPHARGRRYGQQRIGSVARVRRVVADRLRRSDRCRSESRPRL